MGTALLPLRKGIPKPFVDGAGLCSPGRWAPDRRRLPESSLVKKLRGIILGGLREFETKLKEEKKPRSLRQLICAIAVQKVETNPFPEDILEKTKDKLRMALKAGGYGDGLPQAGDVVQHFDVRLIQGLLAACKDPDHYFGEWWARGVWLGSPSRKLPRTPAVFDRKAKWKFQDSTEEGGGDWQRNYPSLEEHAVLVQSQFETEESEGLMKQVTLREALHEYGGDLTIAATGAIEKKGRTDEVRVIYDGSNGIPLNPGIKVRDQVRFPTSADGRAVMEECAEAKRTHFSIHYDVAKAHRRVPVLRSDWGRQSCQVRGTAAMAAQAYLQEEAAKDRKAFETHGLRREQPSLRPSFLDLPDHVLDEELWLNTVGTFGVGSAGYWWGRAGAALIRLTHYLIGREEALWAMLYSDDGWLVGGGPNFEVGLCLHLFILMLVDTPLAWHKLSGGFETEWVGYALDIGRFEMGISHKRAQWVIRWIGDKLREQKVRLGEIREGLGRLQFVAGPLEHIRPFLGPLYAWTCAGAKFSRVTIPPMLMLILKFVADELSRARMSPCRSKASDLGEVFRLDAKAQGEVVSIGGWRCRPGRPTRECEWFAVRLDRRNAPWAFSRGEAFRTIASLELLGALVSVMVLLPDVKETPSSVGLATLTCGTDNQGNSYLLDKLMTTKYPLGIVLMELACQLGRRHAALHARWIPRLQNEEADALTNEVFRHFNMALRIPVDLANLNFIIMNDLFKVGDAYVEDVNKMKEAAKSDRILNANRVQGRKTPAHAKMSASNPW